MLGRVMGCCASPSESIPGEPGAAGRGQTPCSAGQATPGHRPGAAAAPRLHKPAPLVQRPAGHGGSPGEAAGTAGIAGGQGRCPPGPGPGDAQLPRGTRMSPPEPCAGAG